MKHILFLILVFSFLSSANGQQWTEVAALPSNAERHHPVTFSISGIGYSLVGYDSNDNPRNESYKYDPILDEWTQLDDFPGMARGFSYGVTDGEFGYLGFGYNGANNTMLDDLWKFDPNTEEWTELASCPCVARTHPALIYVEGKIFVGAGGSSGGNLKDWWEYDIASDTWTEKQDIPGVTRHHPFYFGLNGDAYVGFGHGFSIYNDFFRWNLDTESWTFMDDFPGEGRVAGTQFSHDGFGYILSGDGDDHDYMQEGEFWQYDPNNDTWAQLPSHPGLSRWAPGSFLIDGEIYLAQGQERFENQFPFSSIANDLWKFDLDLFNSPFSVNEFTEENRLNLYPNPATDFIQFSSITNESLSKVRVLDFMGRTVITIPEGANTIDLSKLAPGTYVLEALSNSGQTHSRFIKE